MSKADKEASKKASQQQMLKHELEKGLASGVSKRNPAQIREAFRKAREAA
ncbi:MAG: hypothetical protein KGZ65_13770 [Sphingomonadales bacterium]|nr:hypothetical protein [Sphingomonadaceae bacterium]MBS3932294.1 hypothetical protein [Sphingomonadales bacterium]